MKKLEEISMMMITYSGMAKSDSLEAIDASENGQEYKKIFSKVEENLKLAGREHFQALTLSAEKEIKLDILFIHAEDQMLNAETTYLLAKKMVSMNEKINRMINNE